MEPQLPPWAEQLRSRYVSGESSVFLIYGNVRDLQPWTEADGTVRYVGLRDFLTRFLARTRDVVVYYNVSEGLEFPSRAQSARFSQVINARRALEGRAPLDSLPRSVGDVLPLIEDLVTDPVQRAGVVLDYAETIVPSGELSFMGEAEKANLVTMLRLGGDPGLLQSDNLVLLVAEALPDINKRLVASSHIAPLEVPLPGTDERAAFLKTEDRRGIQFELNEEQLAKTTAGLTLIQLRGILRNARQSGDLVTFRTVNRRKKAILEQECHGLVEFVDAKHSFAHVGGADALKTELMRVADAIRSGQRNRVPMGMIFVGPMGTGKTFVAEAFATESGLTCLKFKNFREKWVGSTEGNLEKILQVVDALGYVLLILDEADRSLAAGQDSDGGTSSRVIARLKEFMSDTSHRGRVVILMMTNRPDKLDTDLKRPGRFDLKIPFFFPESAEERSAILAAVARKLQIAFVPEIDLSVAAAGTHGYSAAEIESVLLAAANFAAWDGRDKVAVADLERAVGDVIPSRDTRMLEFMELLAVFEASSKRMLPARYQDLSTQDVQERLDQLRSRLGPRAV